MCNDFVSSSNSVSCTLLRAFASPKRSSFQTRTVSMIHIFLSDRNDTTSSNSFEALDGQKADSIIETGIGKKCPQYKLIQDKTMFRQNPVISCMSRICGENRQCLIAPNYSVLVLVFVVPYMRLTTLAKNAHKIR